MLTASGFNISMNVIFNHALHNSSIWLVKSTSRFCEEIWMIYPAAISRQGSGYSFQAILCFSRQYFLQNPYSTEVFRMIKDAVVKCKRCLCFRLAKVKHVRLEKSVNFIVDNIPASVQLVEHLFFNDE